MRQFLLLALVAVLLSPPAPACADDTLVLPVKDVNAYNLPEIKQMIEEENYPEAIGKLHHIVRKDSQNADAFNLLAFAQRKTGDLNGAEENYQKALALDPAHKSALEYQGELFLMQDKPEMAQANLAKLKELCPAGCEQSDMLAAAIKHKGNTNY